MIEPDKEKLIQHLRGYADSVENGWIEPKSCLWNLLILLQSYQFLKLKEKHYIVDMDDE